MPIIKISLSILVLLVARLVATWPAYFYRRFIKRHPDKADSLSPTMRLIAQRSVQTLIYVIGLLIIGQLWEVDIAPLWASLGVAGVAIALGLQETLSNLFAAFFIVIDKTIQVGVYLRLDDGSIARVEDISWRSTRLRTTAGEQVTLPNRTLANQKIISRGQAEQWLVTITAIAGPGSRLSDVEQGALAAGQIVAQQYQAKPSPAQFYFEELTAAGLKFRLSIQIDDVTNELVARHQLLKNLTTELAQRSCPLVGR